jgi:hypothetical protein
MEFLSALKRSMNSLAESPFKKMDGIRICRGEIPPYHDPRENWEDFEVGTWVYQVENPRWLMERNHYKKRYCRSCRFGNGSTVQALID